MNKNQTTRLSIACATTALVTTGCIDMTSDEAQNVGKFIDSPVVGLSYKTDSQEGRTNIAGEFKYADGEYVLFSIGDISLPLTPAKSIVTPLDLADTDNMEDTEVVNILRLLQTLDKDANPDNGIEITQEAHVAAKGVTLDLSSEEFSSSEATKQYIVAAMGENTELVEHTTAIEHFTASLSQNVEAPDHSFNAILLNSQTYYVVANSDIESSRSSDQLDNVYFDGGLFEYMKDGSKETGQYVINNGVLKLEYDADDNDEITLVSILDEKDNHLVTCWGSTPQTSTNCDEDEQVRLFTKSETASSYIETTNGIAVAGAGTSGETEKPASNSESGTQTSSTNTPTTGTSSGSTGSEGTNTGTTSTGSTTVTVSNNAPATSSGSDTSTSTSSSGSDTSSGDTSGSGSDTSSGDTSGSTQVSASNSGETGTSSGSSSSNTETVASNTGGSADTDEPAIGAASGSGTKFTPGHYVFTNISRRYSKDERETRRINFIKQYRDNANIRGFVGTHDWKYLEPTKGNYDFDNIREILEMLEGTDQQYAIYLKERTFNGSCTEPPVPDYLMGHKYKYSDYVCMIKLYKTEVMDRHIALFQALGKEFDGHPNLEFISTGETAIGGSDGYSGQVWTDQLIRFFQEAKKSLPHTIINIQMNFLESGTGYMDQIAAAMAETGGGGLGLPDTVPCRRTDIPKSEVCGYTIAGYEVLRKYNGKLAILPDVETWDLVYEQTPDVLDMAVDYLGATHVVWQAEFTSRVDSRGYVANYLTNQVIPTVNSQGGRTQTDCPASLAPCL